MVQPQLTDNEIDVIAARTHRAMRHPPLADGSGDVLEMVHESSRENEERIGEALAPMRR
jgi:hypothetical protein